VSERFQQKVSSLLNNASKPPSISYENVNCTAVDGDGRENDESSFEETIKKQDEDDKSLLQTTFQRNCDRLLQS